MRSADKNLKLYRRLVHDHGDELYRFAFRLCGRTGEAEDLGQETFCEAWRCIDSLREPDSGRAWLYRILRHRYAHWVRDRNRRLQPNLDTETVEHVVVAPGGDVLEALARQEMLQKALNALEDRYKEPFLMVFQAGFTCQETADELDVPLGTVLSRIHRAKKRLRERLRALTDLSGKPGLHSPEAGERGRANLGDPSEGNEKDEDR